MRIQRRKFLQLGGAALAAQLVHGCGGPDAEPVSDVPRSPFDEEATGEDVTLGIDLSGKVAVVTGCTSGIGYETMRVLALRGAHVVGTGRTLERARRATQGIIGATSALALELSDFASVVACARSIREMRVPIDILVCNAGMRANERELVNGIEKSFVVNHLGHFVLVNHLLERLYFAAQGRVVVVASQVAYKDAPAEGILFDDLAMRRQYSGSLAYAHSKLANVLFSLHLAKLLRGSRITSNALHPGVINTRIARNLNPLLQTGFGVLTAVAGKTLQQGAATSCFVATHPSLGAVSGQYFEDCNAVEIPGDHHMGNAEQAARLWELSETLTRDYIVEHGTPDPSELQHSYRDPATVESRQQ